MGNGKMQMKRTTFFCMIAMLFTILAYWNSVNEIKELKSTCITSLVAIGIELFCIWIKDKKITGGFLYVVCLVMMHFGQVVIIAMGLEFSEIRRTSISLGTGYPNSYEAIVFSTLACMIVGLVVIIFEKNYIVENRNDYISLGVQENYSITAFGWLIICVFFGLTFVSDLVRIIQVSALGYGDGYRQTNTLLYYADLLFPMCVFLIISTYRDNQKVLWRVIVGVIIRAAYCALLIGSRSEAVLDIIMCTFAIVKLSNDYYMRRKIQRLFVVLCAVGVLIIPFAGLARNLTTLTLKGFLSEYNPIIYSLTEFGGTIVNVRLAIEYQGGLGIPQFFLSFLSIFPMSGTLFPFLSTGLGGSYATYLNNVRGFGGLGGSVIGEAAFWFGTSFGGLLYMAFIAIVVVSCLNQLNRSRNTAGVFKCTVILFLLYDVFYQIRGTVASLEGGIKLALYFGILFYFFGNKIIICKSK